MSDDDHLSTTQWNHKHGRRSVDVLKFWPVAVALVMAAMAYGELRYQVASHERQIERQWEIIGEMRRNE